MIVNTVRQALTFKISGVTTLGPGEENERLPELVD